MPFDTRDTAEFELPPVPAATPPRPATAQVQVDLGALSHPGNVRPNNEDLYLVGRASRCLEMLLTNLPEGPMPQRHEELGYGLLVADGMGGMAAGEVASRTAVRTLLKLILDTPNWILRVDQGGAQLMMERIAERFRQVDAAVRQEAQTDPRLTGMGTTMTLAYCLGADVFLGHMGDSRVYLRRADQLLRLTRDHTYAQALADIGVISQHEVETHRMRHVLTRAVGACARTEADVQHIRICDGDQLLLCSDGLSDMVDDETIGAILRAAKTSDDACQALVEQALARGGKDNVTVVVARFQFAPAP
jgi:protein phosphatase